MECSACSAGIDNITTFLDTNYMLPMPSTHMRISRVPACPSKLNDRRRETRNGAYFGRTSPQPTSMAVAHRNALKACTQRPYTRAGLPYFSPVDCRVTHVTIIASLPSYSLSGDVRGTIVIIGSRHQSLPAHRHHRCPTATYNRTRRNDNQERDPNTASANAW